MRYARVRFGAALAATLSGAVLGVGAFTFAPGTERWVGLGVGAGVLVIVVMAFATPAQGAVHRVLDALLAPVCLWTLVSSRTLALADHGHAAGLVRWLGCSSGAAVAVIGLLSLLAHELSLEADLAWAVDRLATHSTFRQLEDDEDEPVATDDVAAQRWA